MGSITQAGPSSGTSFRASSARGSGPLASSVERGSKLSSPTIASSGYAFRIVSITRACASRSACVTTSVFPLLVSTAMSLRNVDAATSAPAWAARSTTVARFSASLP